MKLGQYLKRGIEPTCGIGPMSCESFLGGRTCASALVDGTEGSSVCKESACNAGDSALISELGRSPGEGNGHPLQYSCLENPHGQRRLQSMGSQESDLT